MNSDIPILDSAYLQSLFEALGEEIQAIADDFFEGVDNSYTSWPALAENPAAFAAEAHRLKGASSMLGLQRFSKQTAEWEAQAKAGQVCQIDLAAVKTCIEESKVAIRDFLLQ